MKFLSLRVFLLISFTATSLQNPTMVEPAQLPSVSLPPELARVLTDYENLWLHRDSAALARLFTEDGLLLSNENPMIRGRVAIERFYSGPGAPLSLRAVAFATEGDVGYIIGAFSDRAGVPDRGKFTLTLRRDASGQWLIMSDMDNNNGRVSNH
jgi:ketosteroid isomerase-like protein